MDARYRRCSARSSYDISGVCTLHYYYNKHNGVARAESLLPSGSGVMDLHKCRVEITVLGDDIALDVSDWNNEIYYNCNKTRLLVIT